MRLKAREQILPDQSREVRRLLRVYRNDPTKERAQGLVDFFATRPSVDVETYTAWCLARLDGGEAGRLLERALFGAYSHTQE